MNHILIIIDGILAKHFLERLCFEKGLGYFFTIVCQNEENINLGANSEYIEFHHFIPLAQPALKLL